MEFEMTKGFRFLEHTADVFVEAYGNTLREAFEYAALATIDVMTDLTKVEPLVEDAFEVEATDEYALLYGWVEEILVKFELTGRLYSRFEISRIEKTSRGLKLRAKGWGDCYDPKKHPSKIGVKSITYHQMKIVKTQKRVTVRFILDV